LAVSRNEARPRHADRARPPHGLIQKGSSASKSGSCRLVACGLAGRQGCRSGRWALAAGPGEWDLAAVVK
jgi:hypothetical protein